MREGVGGGQSERLAGVHAAQRRDGGGEVVEARAQHGKEAQARLGQGDWSGPAAEQGLPAGLLQFAELVADRGRRDAEFCGCGDKGEVPGGGLERPERGERRQLSPHERSDAHRDAAWDCIPIAIWEDPAADARNIAWARSLWEAMRPFATGGVYLNNLGEEGEERIRAAFGANYARLAALKATYDPTNPFRANQNIAPSG